MEFHNFKMQAWKTWKINFGNQVMEDQLGEINK